MAFGASPFGVAPFGGQESTAPPTPEDRAVLQLYRHIGTGAPPSLHFGEPAFSDGEPALRVGRSDGSMAVFRDQAYVDSALAGLGVEVWSELLSGLDGSSSSFSLANTPMSGTVRLYYNGLRLTPEIDYSIIGSSISTTFVPGASDTLLADYRRGIS